MNGNPGGKNKIYHRFDHIYIFGPILSGQGCACAFVPDAEWPSALRQAATLSFFRERKTFCDL